MIEKDIFNQNLKKMSNISANIITKLRTGQYISLEKVESIYRALHCTTYDIMKFIVEDEN